MQAANPICPITRLARWVLVWFALALGAAIASPIIKPQSIELLCSASGMTKLVIKNYSGDVVTNNPALDCALCLNISAPPPVAVAIAAPSQPLAYALQPIAQAHLVTLATPALPARGPPAV